MHDIIVYLIDGYVTRCILCHSQDLWVNIMLF